MNIEVNGPFMLIHSVIQLIVVVTLEYMKNSRIQPCSTLY